MKHLKTTFSILLFTAFFLTLASCKNENKKTASDRQIEAKEIKTPNHNHNMDHDNGAGHHHNDNSPSQHNRKSIIKAKNNEVLSPIVAAYIQIKEALDADNQTAAATGGKKLLVAFSGFDKSNLKGDSLNEYLEISESAIEQTEHIIKSPIEHQREHFETLSEDVADLISLLKDEK
ncbi:DUF3347 domain-containing protein [Lutibacter sp.]